MLDGTGAPTLSRTYDAFGLLRQQTGAASSALGFTGEWTNPADGLVYLRARHYAPTLGRFLQRDSLAGTPSQPGSLHRYAHVGHTPTTFRPQRP